LSILSHCGLAIYPLGHFSLFIVFTTSSTFCVWHLQATFIVRVELPLLASQEKFLVSAIAGGKGSVTRGDLQVAASREEFAERVLATPIPARKKIAARMRM
jgi:hypothetical protein